jgi:hypothetical protein
MKTPIEKLSEEAVRCQFPVTSRVPGWFFRVNEVSAGVYRVEGTDLWGRQVSRTGTDPDELLEACAVDADGIARSTSTMSSRDR